MLQIIVKLQGQILDDLKDCYIVVSLFSINTYNRFWNCVLLLMSHRGLNFMKASHATGYSLSVELRSHIIVTKG